MDIKSEKESINTHLDKGNYHAAINLAISAMNECRRNKDQAGVDEFIDFIRSIVDKLDQAFGSKANND
jgi:hypothetical protein